MKYQYFYQTKENENRSGWIKARDRADAYTQLRKQGVKPYRVVGDDPVRWQPWALGALIALLVAALAGTILFYGGENGPVKRHQLAGDSAEISAGLASGWDGLFVSPLDRYLAAYAQPGWIALPPEGIETSSAAFVAELEKPLAFAGRHTPVTEDLARIVTTMRAEMEKYLADGGSVEEYLTFLEDRQDEEREIRNRAIEAVRRAPELMRARALQNMNVRLREMGLAEIGP